jgi:hypothetical protein
MPTVFKLSGRDTLIKLVHPEKILLLKNLILDGSFIVFRVVKLAKAPCATEVGLLA